MSRTFIIRKFMLCLVIGGMVAALIAGCAVKEAPASPKVASTAESAVPTWQQKWDRTVAAGKQEGRLTIYGEITPAQREALMAFQNKYGIDLEFVVGKSNQLVAKWASEKNAGLSIADVFHMGSGSTATIKPLGGVAPLEPYFILPDAFDLKLWPDGRLPFADADKTILSLNAAYTSYVTVNTDLLKEGQLKSYRDLLKPEWKGKMVIFDPSIPSGALGWVNFLLRDIYGLEAGKDYLRQFAANAPTVTRDTTQLIEFVARGRYPIGVGISHSSTSDYKARGAPVTITRFVEGGSINPASGCIEIPPAPPHRNAAAVYLNWLLTEEGQATFARGMASPPMRIGVKVEGIDPMKVPLPGEKVFLFTEEHSKFNPEAINIVKQIMGDLLK